MRGFFALNKAAFSSAFDGEIHFKKILKNLFFKYFCGCMLKSEDSKLIFES